MAIVRTGGMDALCTALRRHADHAGVQQNGCGALARLACNGTASYTTCLPLLPNPLDHIIAYLAV